MSELDDFRAEARAWLEEHCPDGVRGPGPTTLGYRKLDLGADVKRWLECMAEKGWSLNGLHKPSCVHLCVTLRHTREGIAQRFLDDLAASVDQVKENPKAEGGMAPVYGMAATMPDRGAVSELLVRYMDLIFKA